MQSPQSSGVAAFFDLDRTLIRENSGGLYARHEFQHGRLTLYQLGKSAFWLLLHRYSLLDVEAAYGKAAQHWQGAEANELRENTARWFARQVTARLTPGGRRALEHHRQQGHLTVLLSNTSEFIAAAASASWRLDAWLANEIPCDAQGRIAGTVGTPLCIGPGKVHKAEAFARTRGVDLARSYFYGDSISDAAMLARVGHPYAVNPDPALRREARRRGWPIVDWR